MEFIIASISAMVSAAGGWIAAVVAAIAALGSAVVYHKHKVNKAEDQGQKDGAAIERDRLSQHTTNQTEKLERKADENEQEVNRDTATDDDLRRRMRDAARSGPGPE